MMLLNMIIFELPFVSVHGMKTHEDLLAFECRKALVVTHWHLREAEASLGVV